LVIEVHHGVSIHCSCGYVSETVQYIDAVIVEHRQKFTQISAAAVRSTRRAALFKSHCTQRWTLSVTNWRPTTVASLSH